MQKMLIAIGLGVCLSSCEPQFNSKKQHESDRDLPNNEETDTGEGTDPKNEPQDPAVLLKSINELAGSQVFADAKDPKLFWVMPPTSAMAKLIDFRPSANMVFCEGLKTTIALRDFYQKQLLKAQQEKRILESTLETDLDEDERELAERRLKRKEEEIKNLDNILNEQFYKKAHLEGGYASLAIDLKWYEMMKRLSSTYAEYTFKPYETPSAKLSLFLEKIEPENEPPKPEAYFDKTSIFLDNTSIRITPPDDDTNDPLFAYGRLSLIAACALTDPRFFDGEDWVWQPKRDAEGKILIKTQLSYAAPED